MFFSSGMYIRDARAPGILLMVRLGVYKRHYYYLGSKKQLAGSPSVVCRVFPIHGARDSYSCACRSGEEVINAASNPTPFCQPDFVFWKTSNKFLNYETVFEWMTSSRKPFGKKRAPALHRPSSSRKTFQKIKMDPTICFRVTPFPTQRLFLFFLTPRTKLGFHQGRGWRWRHAKMQVHETAKLW